MNDKIKIKPDKANISEYIEMFEKGELQVPAFQRNYVWTNEKKLDLLDSIKRRYPIGSILLWKPDFSNSEDIYKNFNGNELGSYMIPLKKENSFYILDGFQRLSTLFGCLINPKKGLKQDKDKWEKEFNFIYNLKDEQFELNRKQDLSKLKFYQIPIYKLVDGKEFFQFQKSLFGEQNIEIEEYIKRYEEISLTFQNIELPNINLYGGSISEAIEIFQRLNSTGEPISTDWVISASLIEKDPSFRLGTEIDKLLQDELSFYNFDKIKRDVILNCIINSFGGIYFDQISKNDSKKIENLVRRDDFIEITKKTFDAIKVSTEFFYEELMVIDSKLIPYNNQFIFITDFFSQVINPTPNHLKKLKEWFWITTYANYFTIYNLSKQRLAYLQFQKFIKDENESSLYYDESNEKFKPLPFPEKILMGSVRAKALALFMINYNINSSEIINAPNKINSDSIDGYKAFKLFQNVENMLPSNTVFDFLRYNSINHFPKNIKDLSFLLGQDYLGKEENIFINEKMRKLFASDKIEEVLQERKNFIEEKENEFITKVLNLELE
ncbi:MAG: DUF262 domain-containing protein [Limnohabitans sp.]|nr:DUF262 domain-containing protein [Limnohabitans sp.]